MTKQEADFIGSMNMCDEISNEAYKKIMCNCEVEESQPCEDCISREAVFERINKQRKGLNPNVFSQDKIGDCAYEICIDFIKRIPSVTPQPNKGKWIEYCYQNLICSNCGYIVADTDIDEYKYCPNCGTKMEVEE